MFLYNIILFLLYYCIESLQVVDGDSHFENERLNEQLEFISSPNVYAQQRSNTTTQFSNSTAQSQIPNKNEKSRIWIHSFQIPSDWAKYLQNNRKEEQRLNTRRESRENLTRPFVNAKKQSNNHTIDHAGQFQPIQEEFRNSQNKVAWSRDQRSSINEEQKLRTTDRLSSLPPTTQDLVKEGKEKMWIRSIDVLPVSSIYLRNHRNGEQRFNTMQNLSKKGNLNNLLKVRGNNSAAINLPRIESISTLPLWSGETETEPSSYIRYNRSEVPKNKYESHDLSPIRKPSIIGGSRQGMVKLSGLEGDHTNNSSTWMNKENTHLNEEERQKQWIRRSPNHIGWSEDIPYYGSANKNSSITMNTSSLYPQSESLRQKNWFAYSPSLPVWSANEPYFGYDEQLLKSSNQESHGPKESSVFKVVNNDSNLQNEESNMKRGQKPRIHSGRNNLVSPEIQFSSPYETGGVRGGRDMRSVYGQELVEVEENSGNEPSIPVFIPV